MRQNLDIADVESYTKIRAKYLRALENEEWGALPGPTFVRTFLRTYAEAVGIDPHPLVDEYRQRYEPAEEPEPPPRAARAGGGGGGGRSLPRPPRAPGPPSPLALIGGLVVLIVVALLVVGLVSGDDDPSSSPDSAAETTTAATDTTRTTARRPARRRTPRPRPSGVTVRIAPADPTYACLDSGDGTDKVFEGILSEARTFKNARELRVNLGKRQVEITANGKRVEVPPSADPYGLQVTPRAATEITDGQRPCA